MILFRPHLPRDRPTLGAIASCWPLLLGIGLLLAAAGLQSALLGVRATMEGFGTVATGVIMSGYYLGFLCGSLAAPAFVRRVGHVRVFAALASLASIAVLVHGLGVEPFTWLAMRTLTGFAYAGLYVVAESWLNDRTDNATRGSVFAVYTTIMFAGEASGQLLLNAADPARISLFVIASIIVSAALVPILLSAAPQPEFEQPERLSLRQLVRISPLGVIATLGAGMAIGALSGMGAVYAKTIALPLAWVSFFMAAWTLGGAVLQWPVGRASDLIGRRLVMALTGIAAAGVCGLALTFGDDSRLRLIGSMAVLGGLLLPLYELAVAQTHDRLRPRQRVAASSGLMLAYGAGSILGPVGASVAMTLIGPDGFFLYLAAVAAAIGGCAVWRGGAERVRTRGGVSARAGTARDPDADTVRGTGGS
jgi:MFS family permease